MLFDIKDLDEFPFGAVAPLTLHTLLIGQIDLQGIRIVPGATMKVSVQSVVSCVLQQCSNELHPLTKGQQAKSYTYACLCDFTLFPFLSPVR